MLYVLAVFLCARCLYGYAFCVFSRWSPKGMANIKNTNLYIIFQLALHLNGVEDGQQKHEVSIYL